MVIKKIAIQNKKYDQSQLINIIYYLLSMRLHRKNQSRNEQKYNPWIIQRLTVDRLWSVINGSRQTVGALSRGTRYIYILLSFCLSLYLSFFFQLIRFLSCARSKAIDRRKRLVVSSPFVPVSNLCILFHQGRPYTRNDTVAARGKKIFSLLVYRDFDFGRHPT